MINKNYVLTNNFEKIGDFYLEKGIAFFNENNFKASFEFFKLTLEFKSCLDELSANKIYVVKNGYISDFDKKNNKEELFSAAFVKLFFESESDNFWALKYIDKYLIENDDFYGNLIKTVIFIKDIRGIYARENYHVEEGIKKLNSYKINNSFLNNSISLYYKKINMKYAEIIHHNFVNNYTSYNSLFLLDEIYLKCNNLNYINIDKKNFKNALVRFFYDKNRKTETFLSFYKDIIFKAIHKNGQLNYNIIKLVEEFVEVINLNSKIFIEIENSTDSFYYLKIIEEEDKTNRMLEEAEIENFEIYSGNDYYNENLDLDQQDPEFWDNL